MRQYYRALKRYLFQDLTSSLRSARRLGHDPSVSGMKALTLRHLHEQILMSIIPPGCTWVSQQAVIEQAKRFFNTAKRSMVIDVAAETKHLKEERHSEK